MNLSPTLRSFLERAGYTAQQIESMSIETRLYHDLKLDGDNLADTLWLLKSEYGVDLSGLALKGYAPTEGERLFPVSFFVWFKNRWAPREYKALTLAMIEEAIALKRWPFG
jgi:hypothetical protein